MDVLDNDEEEEHKHNNHPPPSARSQPDQNINVRDFPSMEKKKDFKVYFSHSIQSLTIFRDRLGTVS